MPRKSDRSTEDEQGDRWGEFRDTPIGTIIAIVGAAFLIANFDEDARNRKRNDERYQEQRRVDDARWGALHEPHFLLSGIEFSAFSQVPSRTAVEWARGYRPFLVRHFMNNMLLQGFFVKSELLLFDGEQLIPHFGLPMQTDDDIAAARASYPGRQLSVRIHRRGVAKLRNLGSLPASDAVVVVRTEAHGPGDLRGPKGHVSDYRLWLGNVQAQAETEAVVDHYYRFEDPPPDRTTYVLRVEHGPSGMRKTEDLQTATFHEASGAWVSAGTGPVRSMELRVATPTPTP